MPHSNDYLAANVGYSYCQIWGLCIVNLLRRMLGLYIDYSNISKPNGYMSNMSVPGLIRS